METAEKTRGGKMYLGPRAHADPPTDLGGQINLLIDEKLVEEAGLGKPRNYLGGSRVGLECHRQLAYEYFSGKAAAEAYAADPEGFRRQHSFDGGILRIFALGHIIENEVARLVRLAGFTLLTEDKNGYQFGWGTAPHPETGESRMKGHADGVVTAGPTALPYPLLWECKSMKAKKWSECVRNGVAKVYPVYFGQMQTYMAYMELTNSLFTSYNKDTSELYFELVPFDALAAQNLTDRAVRVLTAHVPEELPRIATDETDWRCKFCDFKKRCWNTPEPTKVAAPPAWMK